ncbi:UDP-Glycosyltransferase/glycogen phosphorylase [Rhizophagus irregularis]|uniref:UDP-Glycosyltransferase/glycogen phosphorylase n=1 Tax=Rhizophagus irregularis TaxID=588596 RepID=A0A2I1GL43_9GLOM|nr:UDP-Glycosyltransferase/glycogen phosphorylase [Rhizophagus irregularis]
MKKRNFIFLLSIFLLILVFYVDVSTSTQNHTSKNILIGSFVGGRSHVNPMLDIAVLLYERGYNIILVATESHSLSLEYPTLKHVPLRARPYDFSYIKIVRESFHKEYNYKNLAALHEFHIKSYNYVFEVYKNTAEEFDVDLFFCDALLNDACLDVANALKKPVVGYTVNLNGRLLRTSLVLVDTFFGFEVPQTLPPNIQEIGPVMSEEYPSLTPELDDFLNGHKRVLYVSFGTRFFTTIENNNKLLKAFIEAIDKKIIDGVIWTLVLTSKDDFSPTLNLIDGTEIQTSSILDNKHPHIHISKFGPQFSILNHNNTKLFLSHGGTISCHESLYTGTPMLVFPFAYDQAGNAEKLKLNGVGLILSKLNLDVNDVISKIDLLLKDENVKKNVKRLKFLSMINSKRKYRAADLIEYTLHDSHNKDTSKGFLKDWIPKARFFEGDVNIYVALLSVIFGLRLIGVGI